MKFPQIPSSPPTSLEHISKQVKIHSAGESGDP